MDLPLYSIIGLWWGSLTIFAYALLSVAPLELNVRNYVFCYALLVAVSGLSADGVAVANKPLPSEEAIRREFREGWSTKIPALDFINLGKMCQKVWELYSLGNKNYRDPHHWTWNYEMPHIMGSAIYLLALTFLWLNDHVAFLTSLIFGSLMLLIDYATYTCHVIYDLFNGLHSDSTMTNMLVSWGALDLPYMFFAGPVIFWYAYTSLKAVKKR